MEGNRRNGQRSALLVEVCELCDCEKDGEPCKDCQIEQSCQGSCACCESFRKQNTSSPSNENQETANVLVASASGNELVLPSPVRKLHGNEGNVCELCECKNKAQPCVDCAANPKCLGSCKCCDSYRQVTWWRLRKAQMPSRISGAVQADEPCRRSDQSLFNQKHANADTAAKYDCMCDGGRECDIWRGKNLECRGACSCCKCTNRTSNIDEEVDGFVNLQVDQTSYLAESDVEDSGLSRNFQAGLNLTEQEASGDEFHSIPVKEVKDTGCELCMCRDGSPCAVCEQLDCECLGTCCCCTGYRMYMETVLRKASVKLKQKKRNDAIRPPPGSKDDGTYCHECDCKSYMHPCRKCGEGDSDCGGSCECCRGNRIKLFETLWKMLIGPELGKYYRDEDHVDAAVENVSTCDSCNCKLLEKPCKHCRNSNFRCDGTKCPCCMSYRKRKEIEASFSSYPTTLIEDYFN